VCKVYGIRVFLPPTLPPFSLTLSLTLFASFGVHHTKMFIIGCEEGVRVVVHTANIIESDIHAKAQGGYVQSYTLLRLSYQMIQ
jgi:hypothetical protein